MTNFKFTPGDFPSNQTSYEDAYFANEKLAPLLALLEELETRVKELETEVNCASYPKYTNNL